MSMPSRKINILLVDDRPENLISLAAVLDSPDYNLVKATSGQEALRWLLNEKFALILMDVQMPGMDGFEAAELIKKRQVSQRIPIIFLTAIRQDEPFIFKGYSVGAVDYIFKPFDPDILRSKVSVFADLHRKTLQIEEQAELLREADRLEKEKALAELEIRNLKREQVSQARYRDLVEGIPQGVVWTADPKTLGFTYVSAKGDEIFGIEREKWLEQPDFWFKHLHPDDQGSMIAPLAELPSGNGELSLEHRFIRPDGVTIWLHTGIKLVERSDGSGESELRGLSVEITRVKEAQEAAVQAIAARDEFLSIASHELKTPVTPLKLQVQGLRRWMNSATFDPVELPARLQHAMGTMDRQIVRLTRLIEELLDVSRINNGLLTLNPEKVDLNEMIQDMVNRMSGELNRIGYELCLDIPNGVKGNWDRLRIEQVLANLINNAIKYGQDHPIRIGAQLVGNRACFWVQDQGIGVAPEDQPRIFDRFERVGASSIGGLGLGLFIAREIVRAHEGRISVQSEFGVGSTFMVELPAEVIGDTVPYTMARSLEQPELIQAARMP